VRNDFSKEVSDFLDLMRIKQNQNRSFSQGNASETRKQKSEKSDQESLQVHFLGVERDFVGWNSDFFSAFA
jgi:hypothetical protein